MMPGETHSAAPGTAADLSRCQGCASLQQNLNEYVDALITLKQKIINTDNLLTEYQKKCDELQFARRENSTLHHQVEQMLQKISPLQQCQEELGSLKAELEEKKSSLKLYQDTHQEYARVKEECLKSDAQKRKLEAKVKKLEEAAVKHTQDFKQLRNEKKILEKEFKKTQEKLDEFSKQKNERELRHIGTQISSDPLGNIDKRRVKLLLKELWLCVNTTNRLPGEGSRCVTEKPAEESSPLRECGEAELLRAVDGSPAQAADVRTCLAELSMEMEGSFSPCASVEGEQRGSGAAAPGACALAPLQEQLVDEDLQAAVDFFRMPPPLLSPVQSPPLVSLPPWGTLPSPVGPEAPFGDSANSSDTDCAQQTDPVEAVSEEDLAESLPQWDTPGATQGCGQDEEKHGVQEGAPAQSTLDMNRLTSVGVRTFTAALSKPSTTTSTPEHPWAVASEFTRTGREDEQGAVREVDKAVQTEGTPLRPCSHTQEEKAPAQPCLHLTHRSEPLESSGMSLLSRVTAPPTSWLTEWTLASRVTPASDPVAATECFQGGSRAWDEDKQDRVLAGDCSNLEGAGAAGGLPSAAHAWAPSGLVRGHKVCVPALVPHRDSPLAEQNLQQQAKTSACWKGESDRDTSLRMSPGEGLGPAGRGPAQAPSPPRSVFSRAPTSRQCDRQSPQACTTGGDLGLHQRTSWHQSPVLHEGGPERGLRAAAEPPPSMLATFPDSGSAHRGDENLGVLKATATLQSNQVSVITKQTRSGPLDRARPAPPRPPQEKAPLAAVGPPTRTDLLVPTDPAPSREKEGVALKVTQVAAVRRTSPEVSSTCRKLDFDAPTGSLAAGSSHHLANSILSLSYDHIPVQKRESGPEAAVPGEVQRWRSTGASPEPAPPGPAAPVPRGLPAQERPSVTPATQESPQEPPEQHYQSPSPTAVGSSASGRAQGSPCARPPVSLPSVLYHYTGIREQQRVDTEVEESEAPSCSEGEAEPETASASRGALGVAPARPGLELGALTSALQHCSIAVERLSTSDVTLFLESCRLRDSSSGDSVSECSSKGALSQDRETPREPAQQGTAEGGDQPDTAGETPEPLAECQETGEDEDPLRLPSQLSQCSLDMLAKVLARLGRELHSGPVDARLREAGSLLLLNMLQQVVAEDEPGSGGTSARSTPEGDPGVTRETESQAEVLEPPGSPGLGSRDTPAAETPEATQAETFQCQISTVTSEVINVLLNRDQNLVIEKGDNWTIINGVTLMPNVDQVIVCDPPGDSLDNDFRSCSSPEEGTTEAAEPEGPVPTPASDPSCVQEISSSGQGANFDRRRLRNRPVKPSTRISSEIFDHDFESPTVTFDHTYFNSKLEQVAKSKTRAKVASREQPNKSAKVSATSRAEPQRSEASEPSPGESSNTKSQRTQPQTVLATADTSTPTDCAGDTLSKIRQEVGPPLPPLLAPLMATPPRTPRSISPLVSSSSPTSPLGQLSPLSEAPEHPTVSPLPEDPVLPSPCASPSPSIMSASERILSSPLQFCAATPKHALPVPGRLPPLASAHTAVSGPQENSVKILDTMYPELSARARTLSLLKGNIQLARGPADGENRPAPVSALSGFKAITSTSTAFVKTGGSPGDDCHQDKPRVLGGKRPLLASSLKSAKRLRLHGGSPEPEPHSTGTGAHRNLRRKPPAADAAPPGEERGSGDTVPPTSQAPPKPKETVESHDQAIADALKKIAEAAFDLLPVIRSHVYVGNISKKPVMRDQEKEVVHEFSTARKHLAECLLHSILSELKAQKASLEHSYVHALCRVYVGVCRQLGDLERARLFCYSLLKEDFPESEKLALFIANMWHDIFISPSVISKAMQLVARQRAKGEVLNCLRAFLNWEKNAPVDVGIMVSKLLLTIQLCPKTEFQTSEKFGEDLSANTWEHIFAIDLLCCHQKWVWTHDNIISKELWPVMDKWIKYRKGHPNVACTPDIIIASVLRLIGRLGQLGLKEGFPSAVKNISSVIGMFIQHARDEDIPWGIQLAAVYALCDLSPSNPAEISKTLEAWRRETSHSVPAAVTGCLEEVSSLCAEELG